MTKLQWVGSGFALLLFGFLFYAYVRPQRPGPGQADIIRFICSACAGFAGGLFVGDAMFKMDTTVATTTKLAVTGSVGFAFAFVVWYGYGRKINLPPGYHFRVPEGWTFGSVAKAMVTADKAILDLHGFTDSEINVPLRSAEIRKDDLREALQSLGTLAEDAKVRPYAVTFENSRYQMTVIA
jgi:hypothetical protein